MVRCLMYTLDEVPQEYWDFAQRHGTIYQTKDYLNCLATAGRAPIVAVLYKGNQIVGGTAVRVGPGLWGFFKATGTYFGPVVASAENLVEAFRCLTDRLRRMCLRCSITLLPEHSELLLSQCNLSGWNKDEIEFLHWDISGPLDSFIKELPKGKKAAIKRAIREKVVIEKIENAEQIRAFYDLHMMSMVRGEVAPLPFEYYEAMLSVLKPRGLATGFLALHPETRCPIASVVLLLGPHGLATYCAVGQDYRFRKLGATDLLVWHCVQFLKSEGFITFDLVGLPKGDSPRAQGIRHFKTAWAGSNGIRFPSYIINRGVFGLNPKWMREAMHFFRSLGRGSSRLGRHLFRRGNHYSKTTP